MPKKRIRDLKGSADNAKLRFRGQTNYFQNMNRDTDLAKILSAQALDHMPIYQSFSKEGVDEFWNKNMQITSQLADGFARSMKPEELREQILRPDGGRALDRSFARYIPKVDRLPEGLEPRLYPTAGERIECLKERAARGEFTTPEAKRLCLAEILAAREEVGAGRGGRLFADYRVTGKLSPKVHERSDAALEQLRKLPDDEVDRLFRMVPNRGYCGAMQEAYESLRKTPAEMEMMRLRRRVLDMDADSENLNRAAAEMIWLEKQNALPKEQQAAALGKRQRREEINAIRNSPDFAQLMKKRSGTDLYEMLDQPNAKKLAACYEEAGREVHASPFAELYDSLQADPQKQKKLEDLFDRLAGREDLGEKLPGDGLPFRWKVKMQTVDTDRMRKDKQYFVETMETLQAGACAAMDIGNDEIRESVRDDPDLVELTGMLQLPPPNTAIEYALTLKGQKLLTSAEASSVDDEIFLRRVALHEKVGTGPDWEQKPLSREDREAIETRFQEMYRDADRFIREGAKDIHRGESDSEFSDMVIHGKPRELTSYYNEWKAEQEAQLNAEKNMTARERLDQLLHYPLKQKLQKYSYPDPLDVKKAFQSVLAARAVAREATAHPEKFASCEDVDREYERMRNIYRDCISAAPKEFTHEQMGRLLMKDNDGEAIEQAFRTAIRGETSMQIAELPKEDLPTLKSHIESMQDQAKKGTLDKYDKRNCIAQIIAARQVMNIRPGGDPALNKQLTPKALKHARDIVPILERMPEKDFDALYSKVSKGHGGELMRSFSKLCTYENYLRDLKNKVAKSNDPDPELVSQLMVATMQTANPNVDPKDPVSVEGVLKSSASLQKSPVFAELMKDPQAKELARQGDGMALIEKMAQTQKSMEAAAKEKDKNAAGPEVQPQAEAEKEAPGVLQTV